MQMLAGAPGLLPGRRPWQALRPACRRLAGRRSRVRVAAFWPGWNTKSDGETDDEIFTAAAVTNQGQGRRERQREVKHAAVRPTEVPPAPPRQTLPQFAGALAFVTVGAFFIGSGIRKYILQPAPLDDEAGPDSSAGGGGGKGGRHRRRSSGGGGRAPSVQDLIRQQVGGRAVPYSRPSTGDSVLSSAVVEASREQAAAVHAAAAAQAPPSAASAPAGPPAGAAAGVAAPEAAAADAAAAPPQAPGAAAQDQPPAAAAAAAAAAARVAAAPGSPAAAASAPAAAAAAGTGAQPAAEPADEQQAALREGAREQGESATDSWCETTLEPALRAAAAAATPAAAAAEQLPTEAAAAAAPEQPPAAGAGVQEAAAAGEVGAAEAQLSPVQLWERRLPAAAAAAAPLLACEQVWVACRQTPQGPVALRLLFSVPGLDEQRCVALFEDMADAAAAQRALLRILGLETSLQPLAVPTLLADAAKRHRFAAFYAAGSLRAALEAVEDAALQQELEAGMRRWKAEAAAGVNGSSGSSAEEEHPIDVAELLQAALQQQAAVLGPDLLGEAAACLAAQLAAAMAGASTAPAPAGAATAQQQQQQQQQQPPTPEPAPAPASETGGAPAAVGGRAQQQASWDPATERLPRQRADPGWWLTLPVLHVPQLLYPDGGKGLMSVPLSVPLPLSRQQQGGGAAGGGALAAAAAAGGSGAGSATERRLVAFADVKDAEALADCSLKDAGASAGGATDIQLVSVPPAQLRQHAEAHGCHVAALPPGSLSLTPGASYDAAVAAVVEAVEKQFYEQLLAAAGGSSSSGGSSRMAAET